MIEPDLVETIDRIRAGETTATEDMSLRIARIARLNPRLNAVLDLYADEAMEAARVADPLLPLAGVALGHKSMIARDGRRMAYGSRLTADQRADRTATVNLRLDAAGGIDLASLMMTEFAQGSTGHNQHFGAVRNPWNPDHVTGGSSSGSGAAVASGMVLASLGSDTAGSIRLPASACGVTGMKPTWSRVPLTGTMPLSPSFDCIGPLARSARDCAVMLGLIAGGDAGDPLASGRGVPDYQAALDGDLRGQRIGVPSQHFLENVTPEIGALFEAALAVLEARGAQVMRIDLPALDQIPACLTLSLRAEIAAQHLDWLRHRFGDYAPELAGRMLPNATIPATAYLTALRKRPELLRLYADEVFDKVDMLACPTLPASPPRIDESDLETNPAGALRHYGLMAQNTGFASFLGLPALSAPMGLCDRGLPAGLQLIGKPFGEARLLKTADAYQRETDWHRSAPSILFSPEE